MSALPNFLNMGSSPSATDSYLQQLQAKLKEAQMFQEQLRTGNFMVPQPTPAPVQPQVSQEGQAVLALFEEFAKTDDGKQLVSCIGKFNSYCQSQVAKANKE